QGTDHLLWQQRYRGVPVFDHDLRANVAPNGRLISILGAPVSGVVAQTTIPTLTAAAAVGIAGAGTAESPRSVARPRSQTSGPARTTSFGGGDSASLVLFPAARRERLGWQTIVRASPAATFACVVDARSGRVVWRANLPRSE